jgi:hypothetical protein
MSTVGPRRPRKNLVWILLAGALVLLVAGSVGLNWLTLRALRPSRPAGSGTRLSWQTELGSHPPSQAPLATIPLRSPSGTWIFPQILSVEDAVEWEEGWIILDSRAGRFHVLNSATGSLESVGREGAGPGELTDPVALALEDSLLWVLNERGFSLELFRLPSEFVQRRRLEGGGCFAGLAKGLMAGSPGKLYLLRICPASLPGPGTAWVEEVAPDGSLVPLVSMTLGEEGSRRLHLARQPIVAGGDRSVFLGTGDAPCLIELGGEGSPLGVRCLSSYARPTTPPEEVSSLEARLQRIIKLGLLPVEVPRYLPWYDRAFSTSLGLVVLRLRGADERDLVLLGDDGKRSVAAGLLPPHTFVGERTVLAATELVEGTRIQVYPSPWR